jgi:hypothetical protein
MLEMIYRSKTFHDRVRLSQQGRERYLDDYQPEKCRHFWTPRTRSGASPNVLGVLAGAELVVEISAVAWCRNVGAA